MQLNRETIVAELLAWKKDKKDAEINVEKETDNLIDLNAFLGSKLDEYGEAHVVDYGGSGIVLRADSSKQKTTHALKFPRYHIIHRSADLPRMPAVHREHEIMARINHHNVARLLGSFSLHEKQENTEVLVQTYVEKPLTLSTYANQLCCNEVCCQDEQMFQKNLMELARMLYRVADALEYIHADIRLLHMDVKPDNILVSGTTPPAGKERQPYLTDFGLSQPLMENDETEIEVGFDINYAHSELRTLNTIHLTHEKRAKLPLRRCDLRVAFDLFAYGRTIQELLAIIERAHGPRSLSEYVFNYLHFLASLCLDGYNTETKSSRNDKRFCDDLPPDVPSGVIKSHKLKTFSEVKTALGRLLNLVRLEDELPELQMYSPSTINASDLGPTVLTRRFAEVMNHPTVQRLHTEPQLGMIDTVFPTATHTRLEHALGVYHNACEFIRSLYYDQENPTFRILFREDLGRLVLVAALLHDLGQAAFGHDMEEVEIALTGKDPVTYAHVPLGMRLLSSRAYVGPDQRPLGEVIATPREEGGWGISKEQLQKFLASPGEIPLQRVLKAILDGPLDADKLDYLIRDSVNCRVSYGHGIDHKRFFSSLTTTAALEQGKPVIRMAIKRKGAASAEELMLTRYQMFQSVYWHHTFRCVKAMFIYAGVLGLRDLQEGAQAQLQMSDPVEADAYYQFVLERRWPESDTRTGTLRDKETPDLRTRLARRLSAGNDVPPVQSKWANDRTIQFIWRINPVGGVEPDYPWWTATEEGLERRYKLEEGRGAAKLQELRKQWYTGKGRKLLKDLLSRHYYKRLMEVPVAEYSGTSQDRLKDLEGAERLEMTWLVTKALLELTESEIIRQKDERTTLFRDRVSEKISQAAMESLPFLIDVPPKKFWTEEGKGRGIIFVDDYRRRYFRTGTSDRNEHEAHWNTTLPQMMQRVANLRVFCEPELHRQITRVVDAELLTRTIEATLGLERR